MVICNNLIGTEQKSPTQFATITPYRRQYQWANVWPGMYHCMTTWQISAPRSYQAVKNVTVFLDWSYMSSLVISDTLSQVSKVSDRGVMRHYPCVPLELGKGKMLVLIHIQVFLEIVHSALRYCEQCRIWHMLRIQHRRPAAFLGPLTPPSAASPQPSAAQGCVAKSVLHAHQLHDTRSRINPLPVCELHLLWWCMGQPPSEIVKTTLCEPSTSLTLNGILGTTFWTLERFAGICCWIGRLHWRSGYQSNNKLEVCDTAVIDNLSWMTICIMMV